MPDTLGQLASDTMRMDTTFSIHGATRMEVSDLPVDILVLIFSALPGQDIAICLRVCRYFSDLIRSHVYLQYMIELAQNGMVDGESDAPLPERLDRLRKYSSNFRNGILDHEDLAAHSDYVHRMVDLKFNTNIPFYHGCSSAAAALYSKHHSEYFLSAFVAGSAQAGTPSCRWIMPFTVRHVRKCEVDHGQDLLVTVEAVDRSVGTSGSGSEIKLTEIHFYSLSGSKAQCTTHPAAALPYVQIAPVPYAYGGGQTRTIRARILKLRISGDHVIWALDFPKCPLGNNSIEVCNWKTGQVTRRMNFGKQSVLFTLLDDAYLLVSLRRSPQYLYIHKLSESTPDRPICVLEWPAQNPVDYLLSYEVHTSEHATTPGGHFRIDPSSSSMVVLTFCTEGGPDGGSASYLVIPRATLSAQIRAAQLSPSRPADPACGGADDTGSDPDAPAPVPWNEWGLHGCLLLHAQPKLRHTREVPFGSRMPLVAFEGPDFKRASVYVFDVNPLAARHARLRARDCETTAVVEDVEAVLPGVVDPGCAAVPYVVYRFELPLGPSERPYGHAIRSAEMHMTGFTVTLGDVRFEETVQTWTV